MNIPRAIKSCRFARGLSQQDLAALADISASYLSLIESGKKEPSVPVLRDIATALKLPIDVLLLTAIDFEEVSRNAEHMTELFGQLVASLVAKEG